MAARLLSAVAVCALVVGATAAEPDAGAGSDAEFFAELGYKDVATAADTARAFVIFASEGAETGSGFDADREYLASRGITSKWLAEADADTATTKGQLASLLCRALGIKGGLTMRVLGPVPRYALKECVYLELMVHGPEYKNVPGGELVGVIDRADRYRVRRDREEEAEDLLEGKPSGAE
jgi:hypothetical protein